MFRKVYLDKKVIVEQYKVGGYEGLYKMITTPHEIIFMSDRQFCENIIKTLISDEKLENKKIKLSKLIVWQE
jgi:hypothetical protein